MRNIYTYIFEKLRLNKDFNVSNDCATFIEFLKKIDNEQSTTKALDAYFTSYEITSFDLYFPSEDQLAIFIDDCKKFNITFDNVNLIDSKNFDFTEKLEKEILDEEINLDNCSDIEKKYVFYQNGKKQESWINIYKGKHPEKGIMIECYKYYHLRSIKI